MFSGSMEKNMVTQWSTYVTSLENINNINVIRFILSIAKKNMNIRLSY